MTARPDVLAASLLQVADSLVEAQTRGDQLEQALNSRIAIEQATAMMAQRANLDMHDAFGLLRSYARTNNLHLTAVAVEIVHGMVPLDDITAATPTTNRWRNYNRAATSNPTALESDQIEAGRLAAVHRYAVMDSPGDSAFDRVTALAASLFDVAYAAVSIVDDDRIWFASHHGMDAQQTTKDPGLCASAILGHEAWIVTDASTDPRTLTHPMVVGEPGVRFYAGVPLATPDGHNLGMLCVMDTTPRDMTTTDVSRLTALAAIVMDELDLRRTARRTVELEQQLRHRAEEMSDALRTSLLPPVLPVIPGAEIAALYRPADRAQVGGDFYDLFPLSERHWGCRMVGRR